MSPIPIQDEHETLETPFQNVDLNLAEPQAGQCSHTTGPDRPPRNLLGLFRAFIVKRMKEIRGLRELSMGVNVDRRLRGMIGDSHSSCDRMGGWWMRR